MTFKEKEALLLKAAETDEGIHRIMEHMPIFSSNESVFNTLKEYRKDGPMLVLAVTCFSVRPDCREKQ